MFYNKSYMKPFDWNLVRTFLAVVDGGSMMAAGQALGLTQPGVGRHINQLEQALGLTLFVRGRGGMKLTEAGLALVDEARAMQAEFERLMLKAGGHDTRLKGPVRITASRVVSVYILPPILARLHEAEPEIEIELVPSNVVANLLARDADIAIRMHRPTQNDLIASRVAEIAVGAFAHEDYLARRGAPRTAEELLSHSLIGYDREDRIISAMREYGLAAERSHFAFRTDDEVAAWELVKAGAGIGFGQAHIAARDPMIRRVLPDLKIPPMPVWLCAHQDLRTNRRIRRAMDFLGEELRRLPLAGA